VGLVNGTERASGRGVRYFISLLRPLAGEGLGETNGMTLLLEDVMDFVILLFSLGVLGAHGVRACYESAAYDVTW
jgi:hypothetical protein